MQLPTGAAYEGQGPADSDPFGAPFGLPLSDNVDTRTVAWMIKGAREEGYNAAIDEASEAEIEEDGVHVLAEPPIPEDSPVPVVTEERHVVFGTWVFHSDRGRTDRSRDSRDTHEDRLFDRRAARAAARAERRRRQRQGKPRPKPAAADGYIPGNSPYNPEPWSFAIAEDFLLEEHEIVLRRPTSLRERAAQQDQEYHLRQRLETIEIRAGSSAVRATYAEFFEAHPIIPKEEAYREADDAIAEFKAEQEAARAAEQEAASKARKAEVPEERSSESHPAVVKDIRDFQALPKRIKARVLRDGGRIPRRIAA